MESYKIIYQRHAVERMAQRGVSEEDVMHVLLTGETIQIYADDTPFPSELILGWRERRPLHVVVAIDTRSAEEDCDYCLRTAREDNGRLILEGKSHEVCHLQAGRNSTRHYDHDT